MPQQDCAASCPIASNCPQLGLFAAPVGRIGTNSGGSGSRNNPPLRVALIAYQAAASAVPPRATFIALVDAAGSAAFRFPLPPVAPVTIDFQVVTLALARNGRTAESSNGVRVTIQ